VNAQIQKANPTQVVQECPLSTPYCDQNKCISCQSGQYFLVATGQCVYGCPLGSVYDPRVYRCTKSLYYSDVNAPWLVSQQSDYATWVARVDYRATSSPLMLPCPSWTPYEVNGTCISCGSGQLFNIDTSTCVYCSQGRQYDPAQRRCVATLNNAPSFATYTAGIL
jgi:hypothetical protein